MISNNSRVVDVFAGGGGLSIGFGNAGFNIKAALDNWDPAIKFYEENFDHPIIKCDLGNVSQSVSLINKYNPNIIIGGPPCQDFSSAGKRNENLGRADLTLSFAEIVTCIKPAYFVMENVARALTSNAFAKAKQMFTDAGYGLSIRVLDASLCGVPQIRKRLFVTGELNGTDNALDPYIESSLSTKRITVREYLGDKIDTEYYYRHPRSYYRRAIFSIDEPSPTIRGVNRPIPSGYPGHPGDRSEIDENVRSLSTRERALIQTFPDNIKLTGSKTELEQIIGNAVPVKLAEFVAKALSNYLVTKAGNIEKPRELANRA
ncbi:MAG: DNA (cytosine-5-)-methyltransferase [Acidobacteria bacterium]|nr:DNA (cytosine-5-)-methyltransferase [Acidobacteriota bacterium]